MESRSNVYEPFSFWRISKCVHLVFLVHFNMSVKSVKICRCTFLLEKHTFLLEKHTFLLEKHTFLLEKHMFLLIQAVLPFDRKILSER